MWNKVAKRNPIEISKYINEKYKEYLRSSFQFGNDKLQELFEERLNNEELFKGPYVALTLPFKRGHCLNDLVKERLVCNSFLKLSGIDFNRPLYLHQEKALRKVAAGRSVVVTTGTGSGKTECFLYPILNDLLEDIEKDDHEVGIRAIFLYPMNALLNDQLERVRAILYNYPNITYGFFTGDTKENISKNYREQYVAENNIRIPSNELVSREEIRQRPPDLLFTNYSMLEYLLIRPNDCTIFEKSKLKNWKYIILDEAHSYYGSKGIEISLLLRRVTGLAEKKPKFILTSATLGEQGESEEEIIEFAKNLTSTTFETEDIIFSERTHMLAEDIKYGVAGADYLELKNKMADLLAIQRICGKYSISGATDIKNHIYELLVRDENTYKIYSVLKNGSKSFRDIYAEFNNILSTEQIIALIDLLNVAEKDGIGLFDLKYHSFIRPLAGAYVTLGAKTKLSLTKTNILEGMKTFEIGNCKYCNSPYIIGKIKHNNDKFDYLLQNNEIDIYENYGDNEFVKLDYFLLENAINEDGMDGTSLEEYDLCSKCGVINQTKNLNAKKCSCGELFTVHIYKVINEEKSNIKNQYNNISKCPCCGHKGSAGIVKSLNVGKDEGTALTAQILLEAIDEKEDDVKNDNIVQKHERISLILKPRIVAPFAVEKVKQFLAFSDSRQQASFFATFLDSNHQRLLRKRIIWEIIKSKQYKNIMVDELASCLTELIETKKIFSNNLSATKNAWIALLVDLLRVDGAYDGESLGLYYFYLDVSNIMKELDESAVKEAFGENISREDLATIMNVIFGIFKNAPAINYGKSTLTPDDKQEYLGYRRFNNYVRLQGAKTEKNIRSFLPINANENMIVRYMEKVLKCDSKVAKEKLEIIFSNLGGEIFARTDTNDAYQIDVSRYCLKNYKTSKYYQCKKCGRLTPYNVHNVCAQDNCDGMLKEVDPDNVLGNNFYREQYKTKQIEAVVVKEHTAQLERRTAKEYQNDFKEKKINILSCSTTFEMGIDIGDLETVFMRNVPPTPANYVQRAGRAGRRKDSAAYILTYCSTSSHDYTYFMTPEKMISGVIKPPHFNISNTKIIERHLMATCLGSFFRDNPKYFKAIDGLAFGDGVKCFKNYIANKPEELNNYINEKVLPESKYYRYHNFRWFNEVGGNDEKMENFIKSIKDIVEEYDIARKYAVAEAHYKDAHYYQEQINEIKQGNVIKYLSKYCVIPKYGFPVDIVELQVYENGVLNNKYNLQRDLRIAITEYAPDSEVIVDKHKFTSKYILIPKGTTLQRNYFYTCPNCQKVNISVSINSEKKCEYCGELLTTKPAEYFVEPIYGFKTGPTKESSRKKPKMSYAGNVAYLGGGTKDEKYIELGSAFVIETSSNDRLLVMNKSNFYLCPVCGYSEIIHKGQYLSSNIIKKHKNSRQFDCNNEKLEKIRLGHVFQTDVARFTIATLIYSNVMDHARALSFMYAFLEGVSISLNIERNDIDGILEKNFETCSYDIILYDNVPGGAGHVKRLMSKEAVIKSLQAAYSKVSQHCCDENTSCYNCLRNYNNQAYHGLIRRLYAKEIIEQLLSKIKNAN